MLIIEWDNTYYSEIAFLDTQNQHFVETLNQLFEYQNTNPEPKQLYQRLQEVLVYSLEHFKQEDLFLEKFDLDDLLEHQTQHFLFLKNLNSFLQKEANNGLDEMNELIRYMHDWAVFHIVNVDKSIAQHIKHITSI